MMRKKRNVYQHAEIILERMIKKSGMSQNKFAREILGIAGGNITEARKTGKIPDRWFEVMEEKFGVTREELCRPPTKVRATLEQNYHVQRGTREEDVIAALRAFKVLEWLADEADNYSIAEAIAQITALADYQAWLKKRKGQDTEIPIPENLSDGTHGK